MIMCVVAPDADTEVIKEADPYMTIERMDVDIVWEKDRSCKITEEIVVGFHLGYDGSYELTHGIYIDIPVNSGEMVRNLNVSTVPACAVQFSHEEWNKIVRARVGDEDRHFYPNDKLECLVTYDYIVPEHKYGPDVLSFMAIGEGWTCPIENATVTMTYPKAPNKNANDYEYGVWVAGDKYEQAEWSDDDRTITVSGVSLGAYEGVEIAYKLPDGTLTDYHSAEILWTVIIGIVLVAAVVLIEVCLAKNKPLTPIVDYYPPRVGGDEGENPFDAPKEHKLEFRRMLPVQMGKIIDDKCSSSDVTSLIFYWASNGFLSIEDRDGETYLVKEHALDSITAYEEKLFNSLFEKARMRDDGKCEVSVKSLSGRAYVDIETCKHAVNEEYRGKFYKGGFTALSYFMTACAALFGLLTAVLSTVRIGAFMFNLLGLLAIVPAVLSAVIGYVLARQFFKLGKSVRTALVVGYVVLSLLLSFGVSFVIPFDVMGWLERIVFAACLGVVSAMSPFLLVRRPEYNEQLNTILGFRDFLRDAEKDRLEALLEEDPQYYYNILPYANVLGVSDIWANKFKDLAVEPPAYYTTRGPDIFDIWVISRLTHSVGSSVSYRPPRTSGGSFSGGHSHGGGGGGFSGGSHGGGGGGRW
ncbi:MAG: DUF2207 domain-containing protein [Clostridiales bacterium]|nr:DUF2207 domain-containing protein [Clostridiales bacterium]